MLDLLDDNLGKTVQVIATLSGLFDAEKIKTVLIVNWTKEFERTVESLCTICSTYLLIYFLLAVGWYQLHSCLRAKVEFCLRVRLWWKKLQKFT